MAKNKRSNMPVRKQIWGRELEYVMPQGMYDNLCAEAPSNVNKRDWVMNYINETYGLLGTVTVLHIEGEALREKKKARSHILEEMGLEDF